MTRVNTSMISVHLDNPAAVTLSVFPECEAGPFVSVRLEPVAALLIRDVAVLDALAVQVVAARESLGAMLAETAAVTR